MENRHLRRSATPSSWCTLFISFVILPQLIHLCLRGKKRADPAANATKEIFSMSYLWTLCGQWSQSVFRFLLVSLVSACKEKGTAMGRAGELLRHWALPLPGLGWVSHFRGSQLVDNISSVQAFPWSNSSNRSWLWLQSNLVKAESMGQYGTYPPVSQLWMEKQNKSDSKSLNISFAGKALFEPPDLVSEVWSIISLLLSIWKQFLILFPKLVER